MAADRTQAPDGEVYLTAAEIAARVAELGRAVADDYDGLAPILVAPLKSSTVFLADLSRATAIHHELDVVELARYSGDRGEGEGPGGVRLLKDLEASVTGRHVLIVADVVDTGLTLHFLARTIEQRSPASLAAVALLDRPYRRLVDDLPLRYVGFTAPDELFAGYGLGLEERWRALPDVIAVDQERLPRIATPRAA